MKKMLIVMVAVALAAISYYGTGPVLAVWGTADSQSDAQSLTVGGTANVDSGSLPSGVLYLCADDAEEEAAPAEEEEKEEETVPGVDRTWNVVMHG